MIIYTYHTTSSLNEIFGISCELTEEMSDQFMREQLGQSSPWGSFWEGQTIPPEVRQLMSESHKERWKTYDSTERDKKISVALKGRPQPEERRKKMSEAAKGRDGYWTGKKRPVVTCPHCGKSGADFVMSRWHFNNCRHRQSNLSHESHESCSL